MLTPERPNVEKQTSYKEDDNKSVFAQELLDFCPVNFHF